MTITPGTRLSHYRIVDKLGEGGMGAVYRAEDTRLGRTVALKVLPPEVAEDEGRRRRFHEEARAVSALSHPNIAHLYDVGEADGIHFLTMELVEGPNLRERLAAGPLPPEEIVRIGIQVAEALEEAHARGIVHRDIKPENVVLTERRHVKVLDFGLARRIPGLDGDTDDATATRTATQPGLVLGTVRYMSPEQALGRQVDHRTDLFSLGIMMYELAAGRAPFTGVSPTETIDRIVHATPEPLPTINKLAPPDLDRIIRRCLEKDPERRYQNVRDLATDLRNLQRDLDSGATSSYPSGYPSGPAVPAAAPPRRRGLIAAAAAVLAVAVVATILYYRSAPGPDEPAPAATGAGRVVAVAGFENISDPDDAEHLGRSLMGLVTTDLAESGGLQVVSTSRMLSALRQVGAAPRFDVSLAPEAALAAGADVVLVGQLTLAGGRLLLAAEVVDVQSGNTLGSLKREAGSTAELFSLAETIADDVRHQVGGATVEDAATSIALAETLTTSPAAYRYFVEGELANNELRYGDAAEAYTAAVDADPTFALAYYRLAMAHWWLDTELPSRTLERGLPYVSRLPERWQVLYQAFLDGMRQETTAAYDALTKLLATNTDLADADYLLGETLVHSARYLDYTRAAEHFERALRTDPSSTQFISHLFEIYALRDQPERIDRLVAQLARDRPGTAILLRGRIESLLARRRYADVIALRDDPLVAGSSLWHQIYLAYLLDGQWRRSLEYLQEHWEARIGVDPGLIFTWRAKSRIGLGELRGALEDLREAASQFALKGENRERELAHAYGLSAAIYTMAGRLDTAEELLRRAISDSPNVGNSYYGLGVNQILAGDTDAARRTLDDLRRVSPSIPSPAPRFWVELLDAEIRLAQGDVAAARAALQSSVGLSGACRTWYVLRWMRARVAAAAGNTEAALQAYGELLAPTSEPVAGWDMMLRILSLYESARLEQANGDRAAARTHYQAFIDTWGNADLPIPSVDDARRRLAELGGE